MKVRTMTCPNCMTHFPIVIPSQQKENGERKMWHMFAKKTKTTYKWGK